MILMIFSLLVAKCLMNLFNNKYVRASACGNYTKWLITGHLTQQEINHPLMPFHLFVVFHSSSPFRSTEQPGILKAHYMISLQQAT